jgi:N-acetylglucosamine kinase-like BadF-type ATPase
VKYFIGVEGVDFRKSRAVISDANGVVRAAVVARPITAHATPKDVLRATLHRLITGVVRAADLIPDQVLPETVVCLALTGVTFPFEAAIELPAQIKQISNLNIGKLVCTGDVEAVFASHTQKESGSAVICHSGSVAYAVHGHIRTRFGGWGPAFGDSASGYRIGLAALRQVADQYDRGVPAAASVLWQKMAKWLAKPAADVDDWKTASVKWRALAEEYHLRGHDVRTALYQFAHMRQLADDWRSLSLGLCIPMVQAAEAGDKAASDVLDSAVSDMVEQLTAALAVTEKSAGVPMDRLVDPIVLFGSLFSCHEAFRTRLELALRQKFPICRIVCPRDPGTLRPALGALLFALGDSSAATLRLPHDRVVQQVIASHRPIASWEINP